MRGAACLSLLALVLGLLLAPEPARAITPASAAPEVGTGVQPRHGAELLPAACGPRCREARRAWKRHHYRPHRPNYRPPHYRPRPHYPHHHHRRRDNAAAAAVIGGVIGLGIGAAIANSRPDYYGYDDAPRFGSPGGER